MTLTCICLGRAAKESKNLSGTLGTPKLIGEINDSAVVNSNFV